MLIKRGSGVKSTVLPSVLSEENKTLPALLHRQTVSSAQSVSIFYLWRFLLGSAVMWCSHFLTSATLDCLHSFHRTTFPALSLSPERHRLLIDLDKTPTATNSLQLGQISWHGEKEVQGLHTGRLSSAL